MDTVLKILFAVAALGGIGVLFGFVLGFAGKKFAVKVDERVQAVRAAVAGANCGACGYAGCDAFAEAVVRGEASVSGCTPGGQKSAEAVAAIMGVSAADMEPVVARVRCQGTCERVVPRYDYAGVPSCRAAGSPPWSTSWSTSLSPSTRRTVAGSEARAPVAQLPRPMAAAASCRP